MLSGRAAGSGLIGVEPTSSTAELGLPVVGIAAVPPSGVGVLSGEVAESIVPGAELASVSAGSVSPLVVLGGVVELGAAGVGLASVSAGLGSRLVVLGGVVELGAAGVGLASVSAGLSPALA